MRKKVRVLSEGYDGYFKKQFVFYEHVYYHIQERDHTEVTPGKFREVMTVVEDPEVVIYTHDKETYLYRKITDDNEEYYWNVPVSFSNEPAFIKSAYIINSNDKSIESIRDGEEIVKMEVKNKDGG